MNIRYYFVADVCKRMQIILEYCPTDEMIGDFFTKPLGGAKFRRLCNIIMNISPDEYGPVNEDVLMNIHTAKIQKRMSMEPTLDNRIGEPTIKKINVSSQECVGDPVKESNALWAIARGAHKKPTYAQMVKASNRVVSEVRKKSIQSSGI